MKYVSKISLSLLTAAMVAGATFSANAVQWRGWNIHKSGYPHTVAMDKFAELLEEKSDGKMKLKMFHAGVLGNQPDAIEQVRMGGIEVGNFNLGPIGPIVPEANVLSLPFLFKDLDHMHRVMDGEAGDIISEGMAKKGLVALSWFDAGARSFYNSKKPINTPADLKGMKVRIMNNDIYSDMITYLGGNPSPIAYAEVYESLKTGVVDGAENGWPQYESMGHFEVAGYYSLSQHLITPECICVNTDAFNKLTDQEKSWAKEAAKEASELQRDLWAERAASSREKVLKAGIKYNEIADKGPFQLAMYPVYAKFTKANPEMKPLIEQIIATD